jgi:hypothetical protein
MRIAKNWQAIERSLGKLTPDGDTGKPDLCTFSASAVLRSIRKQRPKGEGRDRPGVSKTLAPFAPKVRAVAKEFGVKASPEAIIALMKRVGIPEAELRKYLDKLNVETEGGGE